MGVVAPPFDPPLALRSSLRAPKRTLKRNCSGKESAAMRASCARPEVRKQKKAVKIEWEELENRRKREKSAKSDHIEKGGLACASWAPVANAATAALFLRPQRVRRRRGKRSKTEKSVKR